MDLKEISQWQLLVVLSFTPRNTSLLLVHCEKQEMQTVIGMETLHDDMVHITLFGKVPGYYLALLAWEALLCGDTK